MLSHLHISNYALIDTIDVDFSRGLNIITGETGAGKSIMLGAMQLLLGERADTRTLRCPDKKAVAEATFILTGNDTEIQAICSENELDYDPAEIVLRREIAPGGRSRAFVNDTPVNLPVLRQCAMRLIDIHSQHQNLLLANAQWQLQVLDSLAGNANLLEQYEKAWQEYRQALRRYRLHQKAAENARTDMEQSTHRYTLLQQAALNDPDEITSLEQQRNILADANRIKSALTTIAEALTDGDDVNVDTLMRQAHAFASDDIAPNIKQAAALAERLHSSRIEILDIAAEFEAINNSINSDPALLQATEERLSELYNLMRQFRADNLGQLIAMRDKYAALLADMSDASGHLAELKHAALQAKNHATEIAGRLTDSRRREASDFATRLVTEASPLGMSNLQFKVSITDTPLSADGADAVEFLFAFNKNQELMPVSRTASGGEISRLMLCIKALVAGKMQLPTIVFDEVDTGVSGEVALRMGQLMQSISKNLQVITITHLPQVAAKGITHFKVYKQDTADATLTHIRTLTGHERVEEIALMLSGDSTNPQALATAEALLAKASETKR